MYHIHKIYFSSFMGTYFRSNTCQFMARHTGIGSGNNRAELIVCQMYISVANSTELYIEFYFIVAKLVSLDPLIELQY